MLCILNVGTVPTLCILNVGTVPMFIPSELVHLNDLHFCLFDVDLFDDMIDPFIKEEVVEVDQLEDWT